MTWIIDRFPTLERPIRVLAAQHEELTDEPLHLALVYDPGDESSHDVFLLEVLGNFAGNEVSPDAELFEVTFPGSQQLPMKPGQRLHLVLTSPAELRVALERGWVSANKLKDAVRRGDLEVIHQDDLGRMIMELFHD